MINLRQPELIQHQNDHYSTHKQTEQQTLRHADPLAFSLFFGASITLAFALLLLLAILLNLMAPYLALSSIAPQIGIWPGYLLIIAISVACGSLFMMFYARHRILDNELLRPKNGCPHCHKQELVYRISQQHDRLSRLMGIAARQYKCEACDWHGTLLGQRPYQPAYRNWLRYSNAAYDVPTAVSMLYDERQLSYFSEDGKLLFDPEFERLCHEALRKQHKPQLVM